VSVVLYFRARAPARPRKCRAPFRRLRLVSGLTSLESSRVGPPELPWGWRVGAGVRGRGETRPTLKRCTLPYTLRRLSRAWTYPSGGETHRPCPETRGRESRSSWTGRAAGAVPPRTSRPVLRGRRSPNSGVARGGRARGLAPNSRDPLDAAHPCREAHRRRSLPVLMFRDPSASSRSTQITRHTGALHRRTVVPNRTHGTIALQVRCHQAPEGSRIHRDARLHHSARR
jgi:hypothetical protein